MWALCAQDVGALMQKGVSEVVRDAARLHEQLMGLKLTRGKLEREEVLLREKVGASSC
jgi:Arc/MetJ-type ribon-helix-helix transcriptional regulator